MAMTIDEVIAKNPWLEQFRGKMQEKCHDCAVGLGERHREGCDAAQCTKCKGQRMVCSCQDGHGDHWIGIMYPQNVKKCLKHNLWCRDILQFEDKEYPVAHGNMCTLAYRLHFIRHLWEFKCSWSCIVQGDSVTFNKFSDPCKEHLVLEIDSSAMREFCDAIKDYDRPRAVLKFHVPCKVDDVGSHPDLNRAAAFR